MRTAADIADARTLLAAQRAWLASIGVDIVGVHPALGKEYADPAGCYLQPDAALLIARLDGRPCGIVGLVRMPERPDAAELRRMYVLDAARGHGAGQALLDALVRTAATLRYREVWLETLPPVMATAARLYASAGFRPAAPLGHTDVEGIVTLRLELTHSSVRR
jgi:carbonic anhydrase